MFTTGNHVYLYLSAACYAAALLLAIFSRRGAGRFFLAAGTVVHGLYLLGRGWLAGVFIPNAVFEGPFLLPFCLAVMALVLWLRKPDMRGTGMLALACVFTLLSVGYAKGIIPPTPKKTSIWALAFFISESLSHALFYMTALFAVSNYWGKAEAPDYHAWMVWGFILYTVAQITGAIWCFLGWGNTFSWGARHLSSAAIWTFYAGCLHLKFIAGWGKKTPACVIFGAVFVFFVSYGHYLREMGFPRIGG